ncbi:hypothetical protein DL93DRAFT_290562 [Clavulina sp. PMI_390]|nr:hypothetical protein DL93DRAFT_290562 [Clavulina sp. PMI_390]
MTSSLHVSTTDVSSEDGDHSPSSPSHPRYLYRGHRRGSFVPVDVPELVELRARQRTFEYSYTRTAMGTLGYSIVVLRLFDKRFYSIGLLYCILTAVLGGAAIIRRRHSRHDFADVYGEVSGRWDGNSPPSHTRTPSGSRIFGRPFKTAGWIVVIVTTLVAAIYITLFGLVVGLAHQKH